MRSWSGSANSAAAGDSRFCSADVYHRLADHKGRHYRIEVGDTGPRENRRPVTSSYASPFSWRYGRPVMRELFSEETKRRLWRRLWLALAQAQAKAGLVTQAEI